MFWNCRTLRVLSFPALAAVLLSAAVAPAAAAAAPEPFVFANLTTSGREAGSDPYAVAACADAVVFSAAADEYGRELWRTDGTPRGTFLLADLCLGRCSATISGFGLKTGSDLSFLEVDLGTVQELWRTDCTEAGTFRLGALPGRYVTSAWLPGRRRMVFRGSDGAGGSEPWVTDGTRAGTRRLADIVPGAGGSDPDTFRAVGDLAWFTARDSQHGRELWRSDGTPAGTVRVSDLVPGPGDGAARVLGAAGQNVVFEGIDAASGLEPWSAAAGAVPRRLGDLTPGAGGSRIGTWNEDGRRLLFHIRQDEEPRTEVWATDGTPAGTHRASGGESHLPPLHGGRGGLREPSSCTTTSPTAASCGRPTARRRAPAWWSTSVRASAPAWATASSSPLPAPGTSPAARTVRTASCGARTAAPRARSASPISARERARAIPSGPMSAASW